MKFSTKRYVDEHYRIFSTISEAEISSCIGYVESHVKENKKIFTCGNGGSASTASHYITDWSKMYNLSTGNKFRGMCLADNLGLITAFGNDVSYDDVFSGQLLAVADPGDLLVIVSGSGNSPNVIKAATTAKELGVDILTVVGFDGGKLKAYGDYSFHVPSYDMQICEDIHLSFGHLVMKSICNFDIE